MNIIFVLNMTETTLILLPYDVLVNIIKNINLRDLRNLMLTCKTLRDVIINENAIWKWAFRNKLLLTDCSNSSHLKPMSCYNRCRISNAWCKGIYRNKIIVQHHANYMPWLMLHNSEAFLLSFKSNLFCYPVDRKGLPNCRYALWKLDVPKVLRNDVRTNDISRFIIKDNIIVCGNRDGSTAIYASNFCQKPHLLYHLRDCHDNGESEVSAVEVISNKSSPCVITASGYSSKLSLWYCQYSEDLYSQLSVKHEVFDCNEDPTHPINIGLRSLAVNQSQDKIAIGLNRNSKPLLLDINKRYVLIKADDTRNLRQVIRDIRWHNEHTIVFVTHSGTLQLVDVRTNDVVYNAMDPFQSALYCVKSDGDHAIVVGSAEYSRCVLYDSRFRNHVQMYFTQKTPSPVYSLDFDSTKLIAAADRSTAALNFNVNISAAPQRDYSHPFEIVQNT